MKAVFKAVVAAVIVVAAGAQANPLATEAGFGANSTVISFSEVALASGTAVTNQFSGVTFATNGPGNFYIGNGSYANIGHSSGAYVDSFSGGTSASVYDIIFGTNVSAAGAYWEFNAPTTTTFTAMSNGVALESFVYSNSACCDSMEFRGFEGLSFDTLRLTNITGTHFYMDQLSFTAAAAVAAVPEPTGVALFGIAALGLAFARRRKAASKA
jgi:hypothetical protein